MDNFKQFETFKEGITDLVDTIPNIKEYIGLTTREKDVVTHLMGKVEDNFPSIYNPEYPATCAISISAVEVSFKTRGFYAFGWRVNPNTGVYSFRVSFSDTNTSISKRTIEAALKEKGWNSRENKPRSTRRNNQPIKQEASKPKEVSTEEQPDYTKAIPVEYVKDTPTECR